MLLLLDYLNGRRSIFDRWFEKVPFILVSIGFGIVAWIARQTYQYQLGESVFGVGYRMLLASHRLVFYFFLRQILPFWPALLQPYLSNALTIPFPYYAISSIVVIVLIVLVLIVLRRRKNIVFGFTLYMVALAPVLPACDPGLFG